MSKTFLIDRFSEPLSDEEAEKYFGHFVSFDENDNLVEPSCKHLLEFEFVAKNLFGSFFKDKMDLIEIKLEETLDNYLKEKSWIKDSLRTDEFLMYLENTKKITEKQIRSVKANELDFFVMIACRELFFPSFEIPGISITPCDDNVFLVSYENELLAQELKNLVHEFGLYDR